MQYIWRLGYKLLEIFKRPNTMGKSYALKKYCKSNNLEYIELKISNRPNPQEFLGLATIKGDSNA